MIPNCPEANLQGGTLIDLIVVSKKTKTKTIEKDGLTQKLKPTK